MRIVQNRNHYSISLFLLQENFGKILKNVKSRQNYKKKKKIDFALQFLLIMLYYQKGKTGGEKQWRN